MTFSTFLEPHPVLSVPFRPFACSSPLCPLRRFQADPKNSPVLFRAKKMFKCTALLRCLPPFVLQLFNSGSTHTAQYSDHCNNSTNNADLHTREICRFFVVHPIYAIRRCVYFYADIGTILSKSTRKGFINGTWIVKLLRELFLVNVTFVKNKFLREILESFAVKCMINIGEEIMISFLSIFFFFFL